MKNIILMNMSGVCLKQEMFNERKLQINEEIFSEQKTQINLEIIDCTKIPGTDCYCDDAAAQKLKGLMEPYSANGLHYIDGGNYHYLSKLWVEKIDKAFDLVVFDHHPDMQPPLFGPILSCGSWIKDTIESNHNLKNVYIIGVNDELITEEMRQPHFEDMGNAKVHFITKQMLAKNMVEKNCIGGGDGRKNHIYISIDKDVLCENEYKTNWDQGNMSVEELLEMLELICNRRNVIGIDVCGEMDLTYAQENPQWNITNNKVNNRLMHFINYLEKNWDNSVDNSNA